MVSAKYLLFEAWEPLGYSWRLGLTCCATSCGSVYVPQSQMEPLGK